jgi:hypothetical protein
MSMFLLELLTSDHRPFGRPFYRGTIRINERANPFVVNGFVSSAAATRSFFAPGLCLVGS